MLALKIIEKAIDDLLPKVVEIRKHLHANPELSLKEFKTADFIRIQLADLDLNILPPFLETDVVALLNTDKTNRNVTLRADMDALPITEKNKIPYCSKNKGVMHACGHDGHTAMLLGAAVILDKFNNYLNGSVRFVFQPGEEVVAAGRDLIEKGILHSPKPNAVLAMHGWPGYPVGAICSKSGNLMAAADFFKITLKGKGGHGSESNQGNNPILVAAQIINKLTSIAQTEFKEEDAMVISISKVVGGTNSNVIPEEVKIDGSTRYFGKIVGKRIVALFNDVLKSACENSEINYALKYDRPYISTVNSSEIIESCKYIVKDNMGESAWVDIKNPVMSSEDFSYYIDDNRGGMFFLGMGEYSPDLHTSNYNFNDDAMKNGILFFVLSTIAILNGDVENSPI